MAISRWSAWGVLAVCMFGRDAIAQHGGHVLLTVENGSIRTGSISEDRADIIPDVRVFGARLGEVAPGFTDEPGFDCEPGTFPVPSAIGFRLRRALREWSGGHFDAIAAENMGVSFGPLGPVSTPSNDTVVTGFALAVGSNGQWHRHLEHTLAPPQSAGVYLMELSLFSSRPDIGESLPFWLVFGMNAPDAELDTAVAWVRRHLVCPADFNGDGSVGVQDIFDFLGAYFAGTTDADINAIGGVTVQDVFDYLAQFFGGCAM